MNRLRAGRWGAAARISFAVAGTLGRTSLAGVLLVIASPLLRTVYRHYAADYPDTYRLLRIVYRVSGRALFYGVAAIAWVGWFAWPRVSQQELLVMYLVVAGAVCLIVMAVKPQLRRFIRERRADTIRLHVSAAVPGSDEASGGVTSPRDG